MSKVRLAWSNLLTLAAHLGDRSDWKNAKSRQYSVDWLEVCLQITVSKKNTLRLNIANTFHLFS